MLHTHSVININKRAKDRCCICSANSLGNPSWFTKFPGPRGGFSPCVGPLFPLGHEGSWLTPLDKLGFPMQISGTMAGYCNAFHCKDVKKNKKPQSDYNQIPKTTDPSCVETLASANETASHVRTVSSSSICFLDTAHQPQMLEKWTRPPQL